MAPNKFIQPLEVVKTTMAAHRKDGFGGAIGRVWGRGGFLGCALDLLIITLHGNR